MNYERELHSLAAETLALQFVVAQTLRRLCSLSDEASDLIRQGLDDASNLIEALALHHGERVPAEHLTKAPQVAEELRSSVLGKDKPKA
ncbi:hypothetical protein [Bradyrhizobium vignae]|uniref:Histidine kinase n=1 Tax=Bradyrhizobium vignae TaxID=1549949 RepID=A0ABS4A774_9BRAD|nr:hypothetical protein [Bradyrhizobium vignae]MBP0116269.1 hypothetical protein [Bradyrhizobium vignae]